MQDNDKLIFVGFISSCSGIKGDVVIKSYTQKIEDICKLPLFILDGTKVKLKLIRKKSNGNLICKLNDISDRNEAEKWVKKELFCYRSILPKASLGEFYIEDLKDLRVTNEEGKDIGIILDMHNFGAGDIVEIKLISDKTIMLPFTNKLFPSVTDKYAVCTVKDFTD